MASQDDNPPVSRLGSSLPRRGPRNPRHRAGNKSRPQAEDIQTEGTEFMKISAESDTKRVAGKIAHEMREGDKPPTILAIGAGSLNTAVKAIAVARRYVIDDDLDIICQPAFREGMSESCLALYLHKQNGNTHDREIVDAEELTAKSNTAVASLAGAIAARAREGKVIYLLARGADAVSNAIAAICKARTFLEGDKLDLHCAPKFIHVDNNGVEMTAVRMDITTDSTT